MPSPIRPAFEFRHASWNRPEVHRLLDSAGAAWVLADRPGARVGSVVTGGWSYVRFHQGGTNAPGYTRRKLRAWADRIAGLPSADTWVFFNNDEEAAAPRDALALRSLLVDKGCPVASPN